MWNTPTPKRLSKIPKLYETEHTALKDKIIHLHFFIFGCDWYIAEFDGEQTFFGYAILNENYEMAEWGFINFKELKELSMNGVEIDCELPEHFKPKRACEILKICKGNKWPFKNKDSNLYTETDIVEILKQAVTDSVIELICPICGQVIRCEPDAQQSFCHDCGKVVSTNNPLIALGLM